MPDKDNVLNDIFEQDRRVTRSWCWPSRESVTASSRPCTRNSQTRRT